MIELVYAPGAKAVITPTIFPDKTSQVWKLDPQLFKSSNYVQISWRFENEGEFMAVAQLAHLLHYNGLDVRLSLSYLPYGRQDKDVSNNATFALNTFAHLVNSLDFDEVVITDPHSEIALELINNSKAIYPSLALQAAIAETKSDLICYPDKGALTKYTEVKAYDRLIGHNYIHGEKNRDQLTGNITGYKVVGECAGKRVLIVDDICDGGATFKILAKDLLAAGAESVSLFVTHGIFSRGVMSLFEAGITDVFTADGNVRVKPTTVKLV